MNKSTAFITKFGENPKFITLMVPNNWYYKVVVNTEATIGTVYQVKGI